MKKETRMTVHACHINLSDLLAKAHTYTHAQMKTIGVKITFATSATFDVCLFRLRKKRKQKDEQMDGLVVSWH